MSKKTIGVIASFVMTFSMVATSAFALTAGDISMLQAAGIINASQAASLSASISGTSAVSSGYTFTKDLQFGSRGSDVTALQNLLGVSPATGYFGSLTKAAVIKYQINHAITPAVGYVGSKTRGVINASGGSTVTNNNGGTTNVGVTGTDLNVSLAATSPLGSALIAGQAAADLAEFTFTNRSAAPAVVQNVTLQRMGVSADTSLTNVYLYNGAVRLTDSASVSSGKITFNAAGGIFTIPAGSSMTISVKADIASGANGQLIAVALMGVTASIPVSAVYPVSGASMSVFSSSDIAQATSTITSGLGSSIVAGSVNQTIWSTSLALSGRAVYLKSLALKVIGSIPSDSLQNVKLYVSGIQVASATGMDANGMITFDLTSAPYKIDSTRTVEVRADVVNGSSRTFSVSLQNASDLMIVDSNYNVGITVAIPATQSTGTFTVSAGSVTVQLDPSLSAGDVVTGASNVALARYTFKAYGEDEKISYLQASSSIQMDNIALYANGVQIGSTKTESTANAALLYSLGSSLIIPAGQTVTVEIRGDIKYNGNNATTTSNNITVNLLGYANNAQGSYSSGLTTAPAVAGVVGPTMRVVGAGLTVAKNAAMSDNISTPSVSGVEIGSYVLQANSSEPVRITSITIGVLGTSGMSTTSLSNLYVSVDGVATTPVNPQASNNFSVDFTVPANTSKLVNVYADLNSDTGSASTTLALSGYGVNSNIIISQNALAGQKITVGTGSLLTTLPSLDVGASAVAQLVVGGSTQSPIANYNFVSTNGTSNISEMYFDIAGPITSIIVGGQSFPVISGSSTANGLNISIPVGYSGADIPVSVVYASIGLRGETSMQTADITLTGFKFTSGNNTTSTTTLAIASKHMIVVASKPTVSVSLPTLYNGIRTGSNIIARVTVSPDTAGPVGLVDLPIKMVTSEGASTTDSVITVKVNGVAVNTSGGVGPVAASSASTSGTILFTDTGGYTISSPTTFDIYANVYLVPTANVANPSISTSIASSSEFIWSDINGNASASGTAIINFPTNSATISY